jgi:hypothetical protein
MAAKNAAGAYGATFDTTNTVDLNNLYPTFSIGTITYPASQGALKDSETATVAVTIANTDTISFTSPNGDLSITNPSTIETPKTVTRIAGSYNIATTNFTGTATRAANAAVTAASAVVKIANVAATITVSTAAARLRSGGNNGTSIQNHTITITGNQQLYAAPTMNADTGGGTFTGSWSGAGTTWTRTLQVHDDDVKATYAWQALSARNLANIETTVITTGGSYVLGGFVQRTLTFGAFSQTTALNVAVVTYSKLTAGTFTATGQAATRNAVQGNHDDLANQFTVDDLATNPTTIWWNDVTAAGTNSSGTAALTAVEETV